MTDETVVDVLEVAEKVLVEVNERVKVRALISQMGPDQVHIRCAHPCCGPLFFVLRKFAPTVREKCVGEGSI